VLKIATPNDVKFYMIDSRGLYTQASVAGAGDRLPQAVVTQSMSAAREIQIRWLSWLVSSVACFLNGREYYAANSGEGEGRKTESAGERRILGG
jgi:hypothetical protein